MKKVISIISILIFLMIGSGCGKNLEIAKSDEVRTEKETRLSKKREMIESEQDTTHKNNVSSTNYGNIRFDGLIAQIDDWIYYSNNEDNHNLYRKNVKKNIVEKLNNTWSDYICIYGQNIYYRQAENENISKMELDGSDDCVIYTGITNDLLCYEGKLYFIEDLENGRRALVELNPNSKSKKILYTGEIQYPMIAGNQIYFVNSEGDFSGDLGEGLVCLDYNTMESKLVCKGAIISPILDGTNLYYIDENNKNICCIDISDNFKNKSIYEFPGLEPQEIVKDGDYIYYADYKELNRISLKNSEVEIILSMKGIIRSFGITENAIYVGYSTKGRMKICLLERRT